MRDQNKPNDVQTNEFDDAIKSIGRIGSLYNRVVATKTVSRSIAQEAREYYPHFDRRAPLSAYSKEATATRYSVAVEEMGVAIFAMLGIAIAAIISAIWKMCVGGGSTGSSNGSAKAAISSIKKEPSFADMKKENDDTVKTRKEKVQTLDEIISDLADTVKKNGIKAVIIGGKSIRIMNASDLDSAFKTFLTSNGKTMDGFIQVDPIGKSFHYDHNYHKKLLDYYKRTLELGKTMNEELKTDMSMLHDMLESVDGGGTGKVSRDVLKTKHLHQTEPYGLAIAKDDKVIEEVKAMLLELGQLERDLANKPTPDYASLEILINSYADNGLGRQHDYINSLSECRAEANKIRIENLEMLDAMDQKVKRSAGANGELTQNVLAGSHKAVVKNLEMTRKIIEWLNKILKATGKDRDNWRNSHSKLDRFSGTYATFLEVLIKEGKDLDDETVTNIKRAIKQLKSLKIHDQKLLASGA